MKTIIKISLILFLFMLANTAFPQEYGWDKSSLNKYYEAEGYIYERDYEQALPLLLELEKYNRNNANLMFRIGLCYLEMGKDKVNAEKYLEEASNYISLDYRNSHKDRTAPVNTYLYLGIAYRLNYKFDLSLKTFERLREFITANNIYDDELITSLEREEVITKNAVNFVNNPSNVVIHSMGNAINSDFSDHSPVANKESDVLYFTSKRPKANEPQLNQDEDIFVSVKKDNEWQPPVRLGSPINTDYNNEAVVGLSEDGRYLIFFQSGAQYTGSLYISETNGSIYDWSTPKLLREEINSKNRETHATVTKDMDQIFFTSNRRGGFGGLDIYHVRKLPNGKWSKPQILPRNINTPFDEETPFIHPDGVTLYFSSKGHNTMGGYDIFMTRMNRDGSFEDPVNLGYPINSPSDDVAFTLNSDETIGYFSSLRDDVFYDFNVYEALFLDKLFDNRNVLYELTVYDEKNNIIDAAAITVKNTTQSDLTGVYRATSNSKYNMSLEAGNEYEMTIEAPGYITKTINYTSTNDDFEKYAITFQPVPLESIILQPSKYQKTVYFTRNESTIDNDARTVLNTVARDVSSMNNTVVNVKSVGNDPSIDRRRFEEIRVYLAENNVRRENIYSDNSYTNSGQTVYDIILVEKEPVNISENRQTDQQQIIQEGDVYVDNILFDFDRATIKPMYYDNLNRLTEYLKNNPSARIEISGHTDAVGNNDYNYYLSNNRTKAVKDYLVNKGNNPNNIITVGYGKDRPIADNRTPDGRDNPEGRKYNRRAEFRILQQGMTGNLVVRQLDVSSANSYGMSNRYLASGGTSNGKYTVQIYALKNRKPVEDFASLGNVKMHVSSDGWYRYYIGEYNTYNESRQAAASLEAKGYSTFVRSLSFFQ